MRNIKALRSSLGSLKREIQSSASARIPVLTGARIYFGTTGAFSDEQRAVFAGKRYHYLHERQHSSRMFLRRSVHRLEKGLISRPLRKSFAAEYIQRTVNTAISLERSVDNNRDVEEIQWARDVLERYFSATRESEDSRVIAARKTWSTTSQSALKRTADQVRLEPFPQFELKDAAAKFESLAQIAEHRRSVRFYENKDVPRELVERAVKIGMTAPSACNRQSFRLVVVDDKDLRSKVASVPMGTAGFADQIPAIGVLIGQHRGYEHERDRHAIYVDGGLFATGFILALEGLGLSTCCINWPDLKDKDTQMRELVELDNDERVIMLIAIGFGEPGQLVPRSHKRSVSTVLKWT